MSVFGEKVGSPCSSSIFFFLTGQRNLTSRSATPTVPTGNVAGHRGQDAKAAGMKYYFFAVLTLSHPLPPIASAGIIWNSLKTVMICSVSLWRLLYFWKLSYESLNWRHTLWGEISMCLRLWT